MYIGETIFPFVHVNSTIRNKQMWSHEAIESMSKDMWSCSLPTKLTHAIARTKPLHCDGTRHPPN